MFTDQQIPVAFILAVAIVIQLGAAVMAFRLIGVTGRYMAWTLIAMAFTVMAIRSIIPLYHLVSGNTSAPPDPLNEFFGLVLSVLLAAGLARIGPLFVECKQAEQASRERSEDIRKLVQDSPVAMIVSSGTDQQVILLNKKFTELFGYTIQDIPDVAHWWPLAYPNEEYREEIKASWSSKVGDAIRAHSEIEPMEAAVTCKDGTLRCIEFRFSSIGTRNLITFVDLTERRQAAEILNSAGEGMYGTDVNGNILFVNPATTKILGYEADELCGRNSHQLFHSFTADGSPYPHEDCPLLKSLTHGEVYRGENEVFWGKGGRRIDVEHVNTPLVENGRIVGAVVVFRDITERKRAEEELTRYHEQLAELVSARTADLDIKSSELEDSQHALMNIVEDLNLKTAELEVANLKLKELDRLKSMFIASMSHELRTPLNSIIGFTSITLEQWTGSLNEEQKKNLSAVLRSGRHLLALVNDIIDISKIEAGKHEVTIEDFYLDILITDAVYLFRKEIEEKGLELHFESPHLEMHTDRRRLLQCLVNLLSNAVKFTEHGLIVIKTALPGRGVLPAPEVVEITVSDTGIGMKEEDVPRLFTAFTRISSPLSMKVKGTGLGLYLVKKIATEILKGDVTMQSTFGKGSSFCLRIPVKL